MTFVIPVRIDPPKLDGIKATETALDGVERKGTKAGKSVSDGMKSGSLAADKAAIAFKGVARALEIEKGILNDIRGPAEKYELHLKAIERLHRSGAISAKEHALALRTARSEFEKSGRNNNGQSDTMRNLGGMRGAALGAGASALGVVLGAVEIGDAATNQTNSLMRLTDQYRNLNEVRADMLSTSKALHSDVAQTADLFDAVRDGSEALNLTYREQLALTKSIGAVMRLDNKGLEEGAGLMEKFSYAMAAGKIESRELKGMMKELPQLAEVWGKKFGMAPAGLIEAVDQGRITVKQLVQAVMEAGPMLEKELGTRPQTWGGRWQQWKDEVVSGFAALGERNDTLAASTKANLRGVEGSIDAISKASDDWLVSAYGINELLGGPKINVQLQTTDDIIQRIARTTNDWAEALSDINRTYKPLEDQFMKGRVDWVKFGIDLNQKTVDKLVAGAAKRKGAMSSDSHEMDRYVTSLERQAKRIAAMASSKAGRAILALAGLDFDGEKPDFFKGRTSAMSRSQGWRENQGPAPGGIREWERSRGDAELRAGAGRFLDGQVKASERLKELEEKRTEEIKEYAEIAMGHIDPFVDGMIDAAHGADVAWSSMFENLLQNIEKAILKMLLLKAIEAGLDYILPGAGQVASKTGASSAIVNGVTSRTFTPPSTPSMPSGGGGDSARIVVMPAPVFVQTPDPRALVPNGMNSREGAKALADMRRKGLVR